ncbi:MAG: hypothetical protein WC761_00145 [Candidatus Paceibacterota bacterium]|jgi:hypothetical protein
MLYDYSWVDCVAEFFHPEEAQRISDHCFIGNIEPVIGRLYKHRTAQATTTDIAGLLASIGKNGTPFRRRPNKALVLPSFELANPWADPVMLVKVEHITMPASDVSIYEPVTFEPKKIQGSTVSVCHFLTCEEKVTTFNLFTASDGAYTGPFNHWFRELSKHISPDTTDTTYWNDCEDTENDK